MGISTSTYELSFEVNVTLDNDVIYVERSDIPRQYSGEFLTNKLDLGEKKQILCGLKSKSEFDILSDNLQKVRNDVILHISFLAGLSLLAEKSQRTHSIIYHVNVKKTESSFYIILV